MSLTRVQPRPIQARIHDRKPIRRCACGGVLGPSGDCERCRARRLAHERSPDQAPVGPAAHGALDVLRAPGRPLDPALRRSMELRFGHGFSHVRVHANAAAAGSAAALGALAYTVGRDIVMGAARYPPVTALDTQLFAHELAHVVQASAGGAPAPPGRTILTAPVATHGSISLPGDRAELVADRAADAATGEDARAVDLVPVADGRTIRRQATKEERAEARLRRLAARPLEAIPQWKTLQPAEQTFVLFVMAGRYGADFSQDFYDYATGKKKPNLSVSISNSPSDSPQALKARGYRRLGDPGGIPVWVHPSGHEVHLLSPPQKAPVTPPPEGEDAFRGRCIDPCLLGTEDEDECRACCAERTPKDDTRCLRGCLAACEQKL